MEANLKVIMFLLKRKIIYVMMPLIGYFASYHCGLTNAEPKETLIISTKITARIKSTPSQITNTWTDLRSEDAADTVGNHKEGEIFKTTYLPVEQTSTLEMANVSSRDSKPILATLRHSVSTKSVPSATLYINSPASLTATDRVTFIVTSRFSDDVNDPIEPSHTVSHSRFLLSSLLSNSTINAEGRENDAMGNCATEGIKDEACDTYVTRWVDFYLNVSNSLT